MGLLPERPGCWQGDVSLDAPQAAEGFQRRFGLEPSGCWQAPGRVNLIGEHTDYNDGYVLPIAIPKRVTVAVSERTDGKLVAWSAQQPYAPSIAGPDDLHPGAVDGWAVYPAGIVWSLRQAGHRVAGLNLFVESDVPVGAGLSSSAALQCAVALACNDLFALGISRVELARLSQRAENQFVGVPVGIMDQCASLLGRAGHALFVDTRQLHFEHIPLALDEAGLSLVVVDSRVSHRLADGEYASRRSACKQAARALAVTALRDIRPHDLDEVLQRLKDPTIRRYTRHVVTENARVLEAVRFIREGAVREIGKLLSASHRSLRDEYGVSSPELDAAVDAAIGGGALGARLIGGGFGGCVLALVPSVAVGEVSASVAWAFQRRGFKSPTIFTVQPAAGARRMLVPG